MSATQRVKFHLLPKDYVVLAALAEEAEIGLSEFCQQLAEVRAATEREKACPRCSVQAGSRGRGRGAIWVRRERKARQRNRHPPGEAALAVRSRWREIERGP